MTILAFLLSGTEAGRQALHAECGGCKHMQHRRVVHVAADDGRALCLLTDLSVPVGFEEDNSILAEPCLHRDRHSNHHGYVCASESASRLCLVDSPRPLGLHIYRQNRPRLDLVSRARCPPASPMKQPSVKPRSLPRVEPYPSAKSRHARFLCTGDHLQQIRLARPSIHVFPLQSVRSSLQFAASSFSWKLRRSTFLDRDPTRTTHVISVLQTRIPALQQPWPRLPRTTQSSFLILLWEVRRPVTPSSAPFHCTLFLALSAPCFGT
jgi:hypothetical protein